MIPAGEFIGKDGRRYRWRRCAKTVILELFLSPGISGTEGCWITSYSFSWEDCDQAILALNRLINSEVRKEQEKKWVYLIPDILRISDDGSEAQLLHDGGWIKLNVSAPCYQIPVDAYRKGLEKKAETVKELVDAVESYMLPPTRNCKEEENIARLVREVKPYEPK